MSYHASHSFWLTLKGIFFLKLEKESLLNTKYLKICWMPNISIHLTYYRNPELIVSRDEILKWAKLRSKIIKHLS